MKSYTKREIVEIATRHSLEIDDDWSGPGPVWPLIERMREAGTVVVLKLDGERQPPRDNGQYTVVAMKGPLADEIIRGDFNTLEESLCYLIGNYDAVVG